MQSSKKINIILQGQSHAVAENQSVLAACLQVDAHHAPRVNCGMGSCYACVVTCNGEESVRSCITQVEAGASYEW